ncbi:MAG: hypothetical protein J1F23_07935 [Oscillospiraceae bacterium]|nr:hypothetical protein [Oscillospiraceae bacterium]
MKMNKNTVKYIVCSFLGILIILYFVYQVVQMNSSPYKTEIALEREIKSTVSADAFVVRDESYITAENTNGTFVSIAEDGKRVASGDTVAVVFPNSQSAAAYSRTNEIEKEIEYYKQLKNRVGVGTNAPSSYNDMINNACIDLIEASRGEFGSSFSDALTDFRDAITTKQLAVGEELSVDAKLTELEAELLELQSKAVGYTTVASPNPGYYIGSVDGYENTVNYSSVLDVNCEKISSLLSAQKQSVSQNVMGKLVDAFDWYLLCNIPYNSSGALEVGETVKVDVVNAAVGTIQCTVAYKGDKEGEQVALVLKCNAMNRNVTNLRIEKIEIVTEEYTGIRINNKAIREQDGEKGVYVRNGNIIRFKKINILYSTEEYSVIEKIDNDSSYVKQYDTVITEGVNLYDGKVVS